jgi:hypothetical protein
MSQCFKEEQTRWWGRVEGQETKTRYYYVE